MTINTLDDNVKNTDIIYCINEYVRPVKYREILFKHWFDRATISELADEYGLSETTVKKIIYNIGDKILLKATKM